MSLITRCPACGTMFKVVTDQLKVSQGWVRCGQCADVFDASRHLIPRDTVVSSPLSPAADAAASAGTPALHIPSADARSSSDKIDTENPAAGEDNSWTPGQSFADRPLLRPSLASEDERQDSMPGFDPLLWKQEREQELPIGVRRPADALQPGDMPLPAVAESGFAASSSLFDEPGDAPLSDVSFVREAKRRAFWKKPGVRIALGAVSTVLLALLVLQWMVQQRDTLAAMEPRLVPVIRVLCAPLGCEVRLPRHIEALVIDSSSFNKLGADTFRLSFTLKNNGASPVEVPSLELTLTDAQDQAVVRRVLTPAQFNAGAATVAAQSELAGVVTLKVSGDAGRMPAASSPSSAPAAPLRIAGYRVLAFYP